MLQLLWFLSCLLMWVSSRELVLKLIWFGRKGYWTVPWLHWPRDELRQTFPTCLTWIYCYRCLCQLVDLRYHLVRCRNRAIEVETNFRKDLTITENTQIHKWGLLLVLLVCCKLYLAAQSALPAFLRIFLPTKWSLTDLKCLCKGRKGTVTMSRRITWGTLSKGCWHFLLKELILQNHWWQQRSSWLLM